MEPHNTKIFAALMQLLEQLSAAEIFKARRPTPHDLQEMASTAQALNLSEELEAFVSQTRSGRSA